jgi:Flp pilus assembly protein TadD
MLLEKKGSHDKAVACMEDLLKIEPDNAGALNFIGYSYAERGINLDKAEEMVKKALESRPDDGYIRDSLAWVFYEKGEYKEALAEILKAAESVADDATITEHLSDIYAKLGEHGKAMESLRKSIDLEKNEDHKKALQEKLKGLEQHP